MCVSQGCSGPAGNPELFLSPGVAHLVLRSLAEQCCVLVINLLVMNAKLLVRSTQWCPSCLTALNGNCSFFLSMH